MVDTNSFDAPAYTAGGTERERVSLPSETFDGTINMPVMHQAVRAFLANQRQGNAATKTRGFVVGGNQKPWRQKGTGRARAGSRRAPTFVGGGTVFGPSPRSYAEQVPRQVRALARKSALNARARENAIVIIDNFAFEAPKTSRMAELLGSLGVYGRKVLILTDGSKPNVYLSGRNIESTRVMPYGDVSTYHVLWSDVVLIEAPALGMDLEAVTERERSPRPAKPARPADETAKSSHRTVRHAKAAGKTKPARKTEKKKTAKTTKAARASARSDRSSKKPAAKKGAGKRKRK